VLRFAFKLTRATNLTEIVDIMYLISL
jgi:hypothetical protein